MQATRNTRSAVGALATIVSLVLIGGTPVAGEEARFFATGHAQLGPFEGIRTIRHDVLLSSCVR
jgi:hypothetical protein